MKKTKALALGLVMAITLTFGYLQSNPSKVEQVGVGVAYLAAEKGASNEATAFIGVAFVVEAAVQGALWGSVFGGPVGTLVGAGIGL
jgi:uncharacterized membrane protein (UPF0136 family)